MARSTPCRSLSPSVGEACGDILFLTPYLPEGTRRLSIRLSVQRGHRAEFTFRPPAPAPAADP